MEKIGNYRITEVDYKSESEDILYALCEVFGEEIPQLDSKEMQSLAQSYAMEQTLDIIKALGQEISTTSHLLYTIEEDNDSYVMTIISKDEEADFVDKMKELKKKTKCMLQPRKKAGSPAKRIDFGKQIKGNVIKWDEDKFILRSSVDGIYYTDTLSDNKADVFYFDSQPVIIQSVSKIIQCLTGKEGQYAAVFMNPERRSASSGLTDHTSYIAVGDKLEDINKWKVICTLESDKDHPSISHMCDCIWYGNDLFLATVNRVFVIKDAKNGGSELVTILEFPIDYSLTTCFFILNGSLFILIQGKIYQWTKGRLFKKEGFNKCIFKMESSPHGPERVFVINDEEVAFAEPKQFSRSSEIQMQQLIVLNVRTKNKRKIECFRGWFRSDKKGEIIVLCTGHEMVKDKKNLPLMVIMDLNSGERKTLPYGCLGPFEIEDIYLTKDNRLLLETDKGIIYPENLDEFLQ